MKIFSKAFESGEELSAKYTCDGKNVSPPLSIKEIPSQAKSLVLIAEDPDAVGGTFVHWAEYNLSPDKKEIKKGEKLNGNCLNDFGSYGYRGPCPPAGKPHRYFFRVYALDIKLEFKGEIVPQLYAAMEGHVLEKAECFAVYER